MPMIIRIVNVLSITALYMFLSACSDEASTESTDVLGSPPRVAYLGVEYYYNFGSLGGLDIHNYSLSNNPTWLSLEQTDNKARQGVIASGIPGITGGRRGELDVAKNDDIRLSVNDGSIFGGYSWDIEVKNNEIEVFAPQDPEEGKATVRTGGSDTSEECPYPDTTKKRITVNNGVEDVDYDLYPVIAEVVLSQPSVEKVAVTYRFTTTYIDSEEQDETSNANRTRARANHDFIIDYDAESEENAPFYEALRNSADAYTPGVVTFEPGVTKCYIRAYVNNDFLAERTEGFSIRLEEVIEGIAVLGSQRADLVNIIDNEPVASFKEDHVLALNEGSSHTYTVVLDKPPGFVDYDAQFPAIPVNINVVVTLQDLEKKLESEEEVDIFDDYMLYTWDQTGDEPEDNNIGSNACTAKTNGNGFSVTGEKGSIVTIPFSGNETEKEFRICLLNNGDEDNGEDDHLIFEVRDDIADLSATPSDETLEVYINEWTNEVTIDASQEVVIDAVRDGASNVIVLGKYQTGNENYFLRTFSSMGNIIGDDVIFTAEAAGVVKPIGIAQSQFANPDQDNADGTDNFIYRLGILAEVENEGTTDILVVAFDRISNVQNYAYSWELLFGSDGLDTPKDIVAIEGSFYVFGDTDGNWERERISGLSDKWKDQDKIGEGDVFVSKVSFVDTELNLDVEEGEEKLTFTAPLNEWTTVVGTDQKDVSIDMSASAFRILITGHTEGTLREDEDDVSVEKLGEKDVFAVGISLSNGKLNTRSQFGTALNDEPTNIASNKKTVISVSGKERPFDSLEAQAEAITEGEVVISGDQDIFRVALGFSFKIDTVLRFGTMSDDSVFDEIVIEDDNFIVGSTIGSFNSDDLEFLRNNRIKKEDEDEDEDTADEEDELRTEVYGFPNQGLTDLFIANSTSSATNGELEDMNWVLQFGSVFEDEFLLIDEVNPAKIMTLTKEGGEYKINMFSTKGHFLTLRANNGVQ